MDNKVDLPSLLAQATITDQYGKQLERIKKRGEQTNLIAEAVEGVMKNLPTAPNGSLVVYGDPQSGKTEMMICLTARLLDSGQKTIVHLMNDSVDLLMQSLDRFKVAGLGPAPRNASDLANSPLDPGQPAVLFCKKNRKDLEKLIEALKDAGPVLVMDDEADYATPNAKINKKEKTKINELVSKLIGKEGKYIGVTATPARLNLNNTFNNKTETWVRFRPHNAYTGQDDFFPQTGKPPYRLTLLPGTGTKEDAYKALARFLISVAYLNTTAISKEQLEENYTMLVHTSGKMEDHRADRETIETALKTLISKKGPEFEALLQTIVQQASELYPEADQTTLLKYVLANASRSSIVVLNSKRDRATAGDKPTAPTTPFTVIIGGNIVSRGVTFPNLLAMFFTRDVKTKLQQDTYIQRARMFGARGKYLEHFELTIPERLYADWHRCFVFHRLALQAIQNSKLSPVWLGDPRISIASSSSIDRGTVDLDKGEMSFQIFDAPTPELAKLDAIVGKDPTSLQTLKALEASVGAALPGFLVEYIDAALKVTPGTPGTLALHTASSVAKYKKGEGVDPDNISRTKGFMGRPQLELGKFPNALHHIKIFHNGKGQARVFYKNHGGVQFVQNLKG
jgi:hypothetical protein